MAETRSQRHSRIYRVTAWISAIVIIALGIYLSHIRFYDSEWLSRAGCLVVMLGIWSGIGGVFQERLLFRGSKWRRRNALTAAKARLFELEASPEQIEKQLAEINAAYDNQMAEASQSLRISIGMLEVSLLMTGTFLWGFGDLLIRQ